MPHRQSTPNPKSTPNDEATPQNVNRSSSFAELLRACRHRALLSQEDLAQKTTLSVRSIRNLESGRICCPRSNSVRLLEDALGLVGAQRLAFEAAAAPAPLSGGPGPAPRAARPPVGPSQLPTGTADFTGRREVTVDLCARLSQDGAAADGVVTVAVLTGKAGVGKTTLAVHVGHRMRDQFPDGRLYVDLRGSHTAPLSPHQVLGQFLHALAVDRAVIPAGVQERVSLYREHLAGRRVLVVLDDAAGEAQIRPLLPGGPGCAVMVTSRGPLTALEGAHLVDLDDYDERNALDLLARIAGRARLAAEPAAAKAIVRRCACLPLAVRIAGAKLAAKPHWPVAHLAERLADERRRLDELSTGDLAVRASLSLGYRGLDAVQRRALRHLAGLDAADVAAWTVAALLDTDVATATDVVEGLVDARLLEVASRDRTGRIRYRLHDLVRLFARERAEAEDTPAARERALRRALGGWLALAGEASRRLDTLLLPPSPGGAARRWPAPPAWGALLAAPLAWFEAERLALAAMTRQAAASGLHGHAWELAAAQVGFVHRVSDFDGWERTHEDALQAAPGGDTDGNQAGQGWLLLGLGERHAMSDDRKAAW